MSKWYPCIYCTEDLHCTKYSDDDSESWCVLGPCAAETPSNGDKIRRMTDEELAIEMTAKGGCPHDCEEPENMETDCVKCWLDWLKLEVESNDS